MTLRTKSIYIICPVRNASIESTNAIREYVTRLRGDGHSVHFPPDDVNQDDPTGLNICMDHLAAMIGADEVHVFWDAESMGSHVDLGMAIGLGKKIIPVQCYRQDVPGKSYWKVMNERADYSNRRRAS